MFSNAEHDDCMMATVLICRSGTLDWMRDTLDTFRIQLRNLRDRMAKGDPRWASVAMCGQVELDAIPQERWHDLPDDKRAVLDVLPTTIWGFTHWVPHSHIAIHAPDLSQAEVAAALSQQWPGDGRVDVCEFDPAYTVADNAKQIISYAGKHRFTNRLRVPCDDGFRRWWFDPWPVSTQAEYWSWIGGMRRGLSPLRVMLGARAAGRVAPRAFGASP